MILKHVLVSVVRYSVILKVSHECRGKLKPLKVFENGFPFKGTQNYGERQWSGAPGIVFETRL